MKRVNEEESIPKFLEQPLMRIMIIFTISALVVLTILSFIANIWIGLLMLLLIITTIVVAWRFGKEYVEKLNSYILNLSYRIKRGEQEALIKMPIGIILINHNEEVDWINPYMQTQLSNEESVLGKHVSEVNEDLYKLIQEFDNTDSNLLNWNNKIFQIILQEDIHAIYLMDITEYAEVKDKYEEARPVVGWLFLDNYDEVVQGLDDRGVSGFNSLITTYLSNWGKQHSIFYKKTSDDKYFLLLNRNELERIENEKFNIIDSIRDRTSKRNLPLTISIGIAYGDDDFDKLADVAQGNLDLALGRGGDQAIVKEVDQEPRYYGGKTNPMEKRTRVRSRMISQAMQELIKGSDQVFVTGHRNPDMDAIGSSLGIARISMMLKKKCWVVIDQDDLSSDVEKLMKEIENHNQVNQNIISPREAESKITENDLVILVDHHKPLLSMAPELLKKTKKNIVIDHHRRGEEFTENPLLVYIEPYASSTAELITELFEYVSSDGEPINRIEATAMLGGIIVDTNNFSLRTGSRTFDAASYLQSVGANSTMIQRLLKEDPEVYLKRSKLIETIQFVHEGVAIAYGKDNVIYPPVTTAQTADTMLSMSGVEAAFVITKRSDDMIGISARSLGKINVQIIMEKMGGGGHLSNAATQIDGKTVQEVREELIEKINTELD